MCIGLRHDDSIVKTFMPSLFDRDGLESIANGVKQLVAVRWSLQMGQALGARWKLDSLLAAGFQVRVTRKRYAGNSMLCPDEFRPVILTI